MEWRTLDHLTKKNLMLLVKIWKHYLKRTNEVKEDSIKSPFIVKKDNGNNPTKS
jgi:hypothetical protein